MLAGEGQPGGGRRRAGLEAKGKLDRLAGAAHAGRRAAAGGRGPRPVGRSDSSACCEVSAGRRIAASRARWVSGLTGWRAPSRLHQSGAIPAAWARRPSVSRIDAARAARPGGRHLGQDQDRARRDRAGGRVSSGPSRAGSALSAETGSRQSRRAARAGRRSRRFRSAMDRPRPPGPAPAPSGSARAMTRVAPCGSSQSAPRPAPRRRRRRQATS